jgi:hypothetical protein
MDDVGPQLTKVLPDLRQRRDELIKELEKQRGRQAELDNCDQEHLQGLREAIAEQKCVQEFGQARFPD